MTASTIETRLRQVAVLVASVDAVAARQVLMSLPTEIAKRVRVMAAEIGTVPPEERRALLAEFQRSQVQTKSPTSATARSTDGFQQMADSALEQFASAASIAGDSRPEQSATENPSWTRLGVETLVRLVQGERPTVIAVVLQQLPAAQAAALLARLPQSLTKSVLQSLSSLQEIDDEAMKAIDEHLSERLRDYHHTMESDLQQNMRLNQLLAAAPPELKQVWANWLRPDIYAADDQSSAASTVQESSGSDKVQPTLAQIYQAASFTTNDAVWAGGSAATTRPKEPVSNTASQSVNSARPILNDSAGRSVAAQPAEGANVAEVDDGPRTIPFPGTQPKSTSANNTYPQIDRAQLQSQMSTILTLEPEKLAQLLSSMDSETILLSLAGASPQFMKRFRALLVPEDAKLLDDRLRRIGQVSLRQIDQAQQRLIVAYQNYMQSENRKVA